MSSPDMRSISSWFEKGFMCSGFEGQGFIYTIDWRIIFRMNTLLKSAFFLNIKTKRKTAIF